MKAIIIYNYAKKETAQNIEVNFLYFIVVKTQIIILVIFLIPAITLSQVEFIFNLILLLLLLLSK